MCISFKNFFDKDDLGMQEKDFVAKIIVKNDRLLNSSAFRQKF